MSVCVLGLVLESRKERRKMLPCFQTAHSLVLKVSKSGYFDIGYFNYIVQAKGVFLRL